MSFICSKLSITLIRAQQQQIEKTSADVWPLSMGYRIAFIMQRHRAAIYGVRSGPDGMCLVGRAFGFVTSGKAVDFYFCSPNLSVFVFDLAVDRGKWWKKTHFDWSDTNELRFKAIVIEKIAHFLAALPFAHGQVNWLSQRFALVHRLSSTI